jgi:hypothetical protein
MKLMRNIVICLAVSLLFVPLAHGRSLSQYRNFSLGASLAEISKQVNEKPEEARTIHQSPALLQDLSWWPLPSYQSPASPEPVQQILFSFYNGTLHRMAVTYQISATEGLTAEDMTRAITAKYGPAKLTVPETVPATSMPFGDMQETFAFWEDSRYAMTLSRSRLSKAFQLVIFSKELNSQADAATAAALKQENDDAPQKEVARLKKVITDHEIRRQTNIESFRP